MAIPDYTSLLSKAAASETAAAGAHKTTLATYKTSRKRVDKIAAKLDAARNKMATARERMLKQYGLWKKNASAIAKAQGELKTLQKAKPKDADKIKAKEAQIAAMHAQAETNRGGYNTAADVHKAQVTGIAEAAASIAAS